MPRDKKKAPNMANAEAAIRKGGRSLAELTGNPDDATIKPKQGRAQQRLQGALRRGFRFLGE